jgi:hypothetical protein
MQPIHKLRAALRDTIHTMKDECKLSQWRADYLLGMLGKSEVRDPSVGESLVYLVKYALDQTVVLNAFKGRERRSNEGRKEQIREIDKLKEELREKDNTFGHTLDHPMDEDQDDREQVAQHVPIEQRLARTNVRVESLETSRHGRDAVIGRLEERIEAVENKLKHSSLDEFI